MGGIQGGESACHMGKDSASGRWDRLSKHQPPCVLDSRPGCLLMPVLLVLFVTLLDVAATS